MKRELPLLFFLIVILPALADDSAQISLSQQDVVRRILSTKDLPVPLPKDTRFDSDPKARKVYLESFKKGYRLAMAGIQSTCCAAKWTYVDAEVTGHYDGQAQALKDHPDKVLGISEGKP